MKIYAEIEYKYDQLQISSEYFAEKSVTFAEDYIQQELVELIERGNEWVKPILKFWITDNFAINNSTIQIENVEFKCGAKIAKHLRNAEQIAVFVATVGNGVTEQYQVYSNEADFLKAYIVDTLGSFSVEKAMDMAQKSVAEEFEKLGKKISGRFSPGLCGWLVEEQQKLFTLLPVNPCGITLSDSDLMSPFKSVCGIMALGENVLFSEQNCSVCSLKNCIFRKQRA